ncbi:MAG: hypothetical protein WC150_01445 [Bacteroidia bacterium]
MQSLLMLSLSFLGIFGHYFELKPAGYYISEELNWVLFDFCTICGEKRWEGKNIRLKPIDLVNLQDWLNCCLKDSECSGLILEESGLTFCRQFMSDISRETIIRIYFNGTSKPEWAAAFRDNLVWVDIYLNDGIRDMLAGGLKEWIQEYHKWDATNSKIAI